MEGHAEGSGGEGRFVLGGEERVSVASKRKWVGRSSREQSRSLFRSQFLRDASLLSGSFSCSPSRFIRRTKL